MRCQQPCQPILCSCPITGEVGGREAWKKSRAAVPLLPLTLLLMLLLNLPCHISRQLRRAAAALAARCAISRVKRAVLLLRMLLHGVSWLRSPLHLLLLLTSQLLLPPAPLPLLLPLLARAAPAAAGTRIVNPWLSCCSHSGRNGSRLLLTPSR